MHIFYTPDIQSNQYTLCEEESKHCLRVLRLKINDTIYLIDGKGGLFKSTIINDNPKNCSVKVIETIREYGKRNFYLHIAIAPTKNIDRFEWFLEKSTEIGIDEITPILCTRSERKVIKKERLEKIITSAVKQSINAYHPILNDMISIDQALKKDFDGKKYIAHCLVGSLELFKYQYQRLERALVFIGPEGDFTSDEVNEAKKQHFKEISLGHNRLRTETAGIVICNTISMLNQ